MGNIFSTLRLALGDMDFTVLDKKEEKGAYELNYKQHIMFWICWFIMVIFTALIFLNFVIAEVLNSYRTVKKRIQALKYRERALLIQEAENVMADSIKQNDIIKFPYYIITRRVEH